MSWVRWAAPSAIVISIAAPAHAVRYLSVEQAQKLAFPDATRFVEAHVIFTPADVAGIERRSGQKVRARGQQVWRALVEDRLVGFFVDLLDDLDQLFRVERFDDPSRAIA